MDGASGGLEGVSSASITTNKGQALRVDFDLEPLISLRHQTTAALRIEPRVSLEYDYDGAGAAPILIEQDLARIDQATLEVAAEVLAEGRAQPAIIIPVSFFTMAARKGRQALAMIAADAQLLKSSVIVEFTDVGRGTPVVVAPSLNAPLLAHPQAQASLRTLPEWGVAIVPPVDTGDGPRLAPTEQLLRAVGTYARS